MIQRVSASKFQQKCFDFLESSTNVLSFLVETWDVDLGIVTLWKWEKN